MPADDFSLRLLERLHETDFWVLFDEAGAKLEGDPEELDTSLIDQIARYIVEEEELEGGPSPDMEFNLRVGTFIYGFIEWAKQEGILPA